MAAPDVLANTALVAAIVAGFGWAINKAYDVGAKRLEQKRDRRAAIIRFYVDVGLRENSLIPLSDPEYLSGFRARTEAAIRNAEKQNKAFRLYGVQVTDTRSHDLIDGYLATFDVSTAQLIREVILLDRQMVAHYDKLSSEAFEALESERQIDAVDTWLTSAQALSAKLAELTLRMETWPDIARERRTHLLGSSIKEER